MSLHHTSHSPQCVLAEMERMRPIELDQFADHVKEMHQDRDKGFEIEYQVSHQLPPSLPHSSSLCHTVCTLSPSALIQ